MVPLLDVLFLLFHASFTSAFLQANVTHTNALPLHLALRHIKWKIKWEEKNTCFYFSFVFSCSRDACYFDGIHFVDLQPFWAFLSAFMLRISHTCNHICITTWHHIHKQLKIWIVEMICGSHCIDLFICPDWLPLKHGDVADQTEVFSVKLF